MITTIRAELVKLRTTRLPLGLLALAAGLNALVAVVTSARAGSASSMTIPPLDTTAGLRMVLTSTGFALLVAMVFGVTVASGEFRHRTATDTYLDQPDRVRVLLAKAVAAAGVGLVFGLVGAAITTGVGLAFVAAKGDQVALAASTIARFAAGTVLGSGCWPRSASASVRCSEARSPPSSPCSSGRSGSSRSWAGWRAPPPLPALHGRGHHGRRHRRRGHATASLRAEPPALRHRGSAPGRRHRRALDPGSTHHRAARHHLATGTPPFTESEPEPDPDGRLARIPQHRTITQPG